MTKLITFALALCLALAGRAAAAVATDLRCDGLVDPLAAGEAAPELSWTVQSGSRGDGQTAYQVLVAGDRAALDADRGELWDTGRTNGEPSAWIAYAGRSLPAGKACWWKVRLWDRAGKPGPWSPIARFGVGLLKPEDWHRAVWIARRPEDEWKHRWDAQVAAELRGAPMSFPWRTGQGRSIFEDYDASANAYDPAPLLRKRFATRGPVARAVLYVCGLGYYEAYLNGGRVGDHVLDPAWTQFDRRAFYAAYDVTAQLKAGDNALGVTLGRGEYGPLCNDIWGIRQASWVAQPKLIARLSLTYADGTSDDVVTGPDWRVAPGPIVYDDDRYGELYDARLEKPGWSTAAYDDAAWGAASTVPSSTRLEAQPIPPIRAFPAIQPVHLDPGPHGEQLFDVGQNIAGWARVTVRGPAGAKVLVDYVETTLDAAVNKGYCGAWGNHLGHGPGEDPFREVTAEVRQQNGYVLAGGGTETFECHFSYKGFQFIRVAADPGVTIDRVEAVPVHTDVEPAGSFACSNDLLNQIQDNARRTFLNNFHGIQTDCPHREKQGWTADIYLSAEAAMCNFDLDRFYATWVGDLAQTQDDHGGLSQVAPSSRGGTGTSTLWPAAIALVPADLYACYGDRAALSDNYDAMVRFARSSRSHGAGGKPELVSDPLGDWLSPLPHAGGPAHTYQQPPPEGNVVYATAAQFRVVRALRDIAHTLGRTDDEREFDAWSQRIRAAFNDAFLDAGRATYHGERATADYRQAANAVALDYGLVPEESRTAVLDNLVAHLGATNPRLNTGFVGTPALLDVLAAERPEVAYALVTRTAYPSWGYMVKAGHASTMWESWGGDASHDHPMFGCVSAYFYRYLAGIQPDPDGPGFGRFVIRPSVVGDLTWVRCHYDSAHGRIVSDWRRAGDRLRMDVTVPANTSALVCVPTADPAGVTEGDVPAERADGVTLVRVEGGRAAYRVGAGSYHFESRLEKQ